MAAGFGFGFGFGYDLDHDGTLPAGGFSSLLLSDSDDVVSPPLFSFDTPKMLCFGDFSNHNTDPPSQITSQSISSSSPVSKSSSNASINSLPSSSISNKRRSASPPEKKAAPGTGVPKGKSASKKIRPASTAGHAIVKPRGKKKEKIGDRIATLQHLVSPYGKTDTASVLHETMGYIRFLQDQVKVLCTPYLQCLSSPSLPTPSHGENFEFRDSTQGLKMKGLCLVPVEGILEITSCNGADLWSRVTNKTVTTVGAATTTTNC